MGLELLYLSLCRTSLAYRLVVLCAISCSLARPWCALSSCSVVGLCALLYGCWCRYGRRVHCVGSVVLCAWAVFSAVRLSVCSADFACGLVSPLVICAALLPPFRGELCVELASVAGCVRFFAVAVLMCGVFGGPSSVFVERIGSRSYAGLFMVVSWQIGSFSVMVARSWVLVFFCLFLIWACVG